MILDLAKTGNTSCEADVLVIGAGTVGLIIATHLSKKGLNVVVLESGGLRQDAEEHPLNQVVYRNARYAGAAHGRFRCLGGTSTRWGGAMIPFLPVDMARDGWPISYGEVAGYLPEVERLFGLWPGPYEVEGILSPDSRAAPDHIARLAKWPAFSNRNVANLLSSEIRSETGPTIWLNATATTFNVEDGRLREVVAESPENTSIRVHAKEIVIAAGAIEATRLLLLLDVQNGGGICAPDDQLGRFFYDHLSVMIAHLEVSDRKKFNRTAGFRFEKGGVMRNLRFELSETSKLRREIPPCFAHVAFQDRPGSGFDALRLFFQSVQQRRLPEIAMFRTLATSIPWLAQAIWWRFVEKRLLYPAEAELQVHMIIEQVPRAENRITLSETRRDRYGVPLAEIDWSVGDADVANLARATDALQKTWGQSRLADISRFVRRPDGEAGAELTKGGGIYHPGGSTRMGRAPSEAVVDKDIRLFRLPNVSVAATSVLPRGGGANPTMMLIMLGLRCADRISGQFGRSLSCCAAADTGLSSKVERS